MLTNLFPITCLGLSPFVCVCVFFNSLLYLLGFHLISPVDLTAQSAVLGQDSATASPP